MMTDECAGSQEEIDGVTYNVKPGTLCEFPYFARNSYSCPDGYQIAVMNDDCTGFCISSDTTTVAAFASVGAYPMANSTCTTPGSVYPLSCDCSSGGNCASGLYHGCIDNENNIACSSDYDKVCYNGGTEYTCLNCEGTFYNYDCNNCQCTINAGAVAAVVIGIVAGVIILGLLCCCIVSCLQADAHKKRQIAEETKLDCPA